ncbi:hypothetical protein [Pseudonocardia sp.]|uniref:hypothetical protein n=1 Tax=Pseudonocardia sp. TaxID=60912 RepID=UPI002D7F15A6|nr:hypothetical protein [Pseudonocardia sp.]
MANRNVTPDDAWGAVDWLRHASVVLRRLARHATPGPWRWGDRDVAEGNLERRRTTLERSPIHPGFPAIRMRDDDAEVVLPGLSDPLDLFEDALDSIYPHAKANARWLTVVNPSIAEPLATLLDFLARDAEQTLKAGGSVDQEPYRSAVALAKTIIEAAQE